MNTVLLDHAWNKKYVAFSQWKLGLDHGLKTPNHGSRLQSTFNDYVAFIMFISLKLRILMVSMKSVISNDW